jgi:hypothetical protein
MNSEMSTTKENVIWEEKNLIEPKKKLENSGESDACGIITGTKEESEKKISNDTTEKMIGICRLKNNTEYHQKHSDRMKKERLEKFLNNERLKFDKYSKYCNKIFTI